MGTQTTELSKEKIKGWVFKQGRAGKDQVQSRDWLESYRKSIGMYIYGHMGDLVSER